MRTSSRLAQQRCQRQGNAEGRTGEGKDSRNVHPPNSERDRYCVSRSSALIPRGVGTARKLRNGQPFVNQPICALPSRVPPISPQNWALDATEKNGDNRRTVAKNWICKANGK